MKLDELDYEYPSFIESFKEYKMNMKFLMI